MSKSNSEIHIKELEDIALEYRASKRAGSEIRGEFTIIQDKDLYGDLSSTLGIYDIYFEEIPLIVRNAFITQMYTQAAWPYEYGERVVTYSFIVYPQKGETKPGLPHFGS